jgi:hypothetical protein
MREEQRAQCQGDEVDFAPAVSAHSTIVGSRPLFSQSAITLNEAQFHVCVCVCDACGVVCGT